jgi:hypothetical protein
MRHCTGNATRRFCSGLPGTDFVNPASQIGADALTSLFPVDFSSRSVYAEVGKCLQVRSPRVYDKPALEQVTRDLMQLANQVVNDKGH